MEFTSLNFYSILIFLILGIIVIYLIYNYYLRLKKFEKNNTKFAINKKTFYAFIFLIISFFIVLFSIFQIKYGEKKSKIKNSGIDVMFVLDVSKSMNTADITKGNYAYSRLLLAKKAISDFVVKHKNDRFGLIIFAGDATSTVPLTIDHDIFLTFLDNVDYKNLVKQGSDFKKALKLAVNRFAVSDDRSKALVFISDGGDSDDIINTSEIKKLFKDKKIKTFVVGIGTEKGGRIIKGRNAFGDYIYQKYKGDYVISKLNYNNLRQIAKAINGDYFVLNKVGDLQKLDSKINSLAKKALETNSFGEKNDFGRNLAIFSFIFFLSFLYFYLRKTTS